MTVAKVIEIIAEGKTIEDAVNNGIREAAETVKNIKHIDIKHIHANVERNKVIAFRVIIKVSFIIERAKKTK